MIDEQVAYVMSTLGALFEVTLNADCMPFRSIVDHVEPGIFRITLDPPYVLFVDVNRSVVDDPGGLLPSDFPGRLPVSRSYRLTWRDGQGLPMSAAVRASSRRFARLFARAPRRAYVELA
jgi:hypothetical protein